ncbi:hypothetical protein L9F63_005576, partial [Diploptera punctata]
LKIYKIVILLPLWKRDIKANGILICWPIIVGPSRGMLHRRNIAENRHFLLSRVGFTNRVTYVGETDTKPVSPVHPHPAHSFDIIFFSK